MTDIAVEFGVAPASQVVTNLNASGPGSLSQAVIDANVRGTWLACRSAGRQLIEQGDGGRVVLVSLADRCSGWCHLPVVEDDDRVVGVGRVVRVVEDRLERNDHRVGHHRAVHRLQADQPLRDALRELHDAQKRSQP